MTSQGGEEAVENDETGGADNEGNVLNLLIAAVHQNNAEVRSNMLCPC